MSHEKPQHGLGARLKALAPDTDRSGKPGSGLPWRNAIHAGFQSQSSVAFLPNSAPQRRVCNLSRTDS